jgi:hypothetical protein
LLSAFAALHGSCLFLFGLRNVREENLLRHSRNDQV